jgi:hypothetical protein
VNSPTYTYLVRMPHTLRVRIQARAVQERRSFNGQLLALAEDGLQEREAQLAPRQVAAVIQAIGAKK